MKKFIFVIVTVVIICLLGVSLAGCNRATPTQKLLSNSRAWTSDVTDETLVYDVIYKSATKDQVKGTMTVNVKSYDKEKVEIGDWSLDNAVGYVATTELVMDNGDVKKTAAFFTTTIQVKYAQCTQTIGGVTGGYTAEYKNEKCYYTTTDGSDKGQGEIKVGDFNESPYIDNAILYQVARCLPDSVSSFTFDVPDVTLGEAQSVTMSATRSSTTGIKGADEAQTEYVCYFVYISLNRTFPGSGESLKCAVASTPYPSADNPKINNLIVQITEGDTLYTLKSATYAE